VWVVRYPKLDSVLWQEIPDALVSFAKIVNRPIGTPARWSFSNLRQTCGIAKLQAGKHRRTTESITRTQTDVTTQKEKFQPSWMFR